MITKQPWPDSSSFGYLTLLFFVAFSIHLYAEPPVRISSDAFYYDQKCAQLKGNVIVEYGTTRIRSEQAQTVGHERLELWQEVSLEWEGREATLLCDRVLLDYPEGKILCRGEQSPLVFTDLTQVPLIVEAPVMRVGCDPKTLRINSLNIDEPRGRIEENPPIRFSARKMDWDPSECILRLEKEIEVWIGEKSVLKAPETASLYFQQGELNKIVCEGPAYFTYLDTPQSTEDRRLTSPGGFVLEYPQNKITFSKMGSSSSEQVLVEDPYGEIFADVITIEYTRQGGSILPSRIICNGHVKILNRYIHSGEELGGHMQYVIADVAIYTPASSLMEFKSSPPRRVLFYDKTKSLKVSAPKITLRRDEAALKETIQGHGDVRFSFNQVEMQQMLQRFGLIQEQRDLPSEDSIEAKKESRTEQLHPGKTTHE